MTLSHYIYLGFNLFYLLLFVFLLLPYTRKLFKYDWKENIDLSFTHAKIMWVICVMYIYFSLLHHSYHDTELEKVYNCASAFMFFVMWWQTYLRIQHSYDCGIFNLEAETEDEDTVDF